MPRIPVKDKMMHINGNPGDGVIDEYITLCGIDISSGSTNFFESNGSYGLQAPQDAFEKEDECIRNGYQNYINKCTICQYEFIKRFRAID